MNNLTQNNNKVKITTTVVNIGWGSLKLITLLNCLEGGGSHKIITEIHFGGGLPPNNYS